METIGQGEVDGQWYDAIGGEFARRGGNICDNARDDSGNDQECTAGGGVICDESWSDAVGEQIHLAKTEVEPLPRTPEETTNHKKFINLANHQLHPNLCVLLEKGPNYALSRRITSHTMKDVEVGLERGRLLFVGRKR